MRLRYEALLSAALRDIAAKPLTPAAWRAPKLATPFAPIICAIAARAIDPAEAFESPGITCFTGA